MFPINFQFLNQLVSELKKRGCDISVQETTICFSRTTWDRHEQRSFLMASAAPAITHVNKSFFVYVSEQHDEKGSVKKYSVKLCNSLKQEIRAWDRDTKRGQHTHDYLSVDGGKSHDPHDGSISDIAGEIVLVMDL